MSELRQDLVSGEWVVIAPGRASRPHEFGVKTALREHASKDSCPFEDLHASGNAPLVVYPKGGDWKIAVIPNKFPILDYSHVCAVKKAHGPYASLEGKGHHEVIVTRDHDRNFAHMSHEEVEKVFSVFKERYATLSGDECTKYISLFHAWGPRAGASIYHPHFQVLALPILPPHVEDSLAGVEQYFKQKGSCVHCDIIAFEKRDARRVVFENDAAIALAPYASRQPFEIKIFPKSHEVRFEHTSPQTLKDVSDALREILRKFERFLGDPDYNFFIHTAPTSTKATIYHWHVEVLPKTSVFGGLEWGTGIIVNMVDPDMVSGILNR